jgi:hypothetical protein
VWPVGDLGIRHGYALARGLDSPLSPAELTPLGDRFRPYRSVVARYCWEAVHLYRGRMWFLGMEAARRGGNMLDTADVFATIPSWSLIGRSTM